MIYLNFSLALLLIQRIYVTGALAEIVLECQRIWRDLKLRYVYDGLTPLRYAHALKTCGNKSYRLAQLKNAGFPVPDGVVAGNYLLVKYSAMTEAQKTTFFNQIWRMVGRCPCVVRSSGSDEDGMDQSFAGVFDSVLDVDRAGLKSAFEQVLASFKSSRAGAYQGGGDTGHRGNILIQRMVDAQYSGVLFTQDPMSPGQMMLELAKGTADDLVSGRVTPLSLRFGRYTQQSCDDNVAPVDLVPLLKLGQSVERLFGYPQDIEWAYRDGAFYLVQSRDITTLNRGSKAEQARQKQWAEVFETFGQSPLDGPILQQDEMSEVLPRPTPLSFSIMSSLWAPGGSVDMACRKLGLSYKMPEVEQGHLVQLFGKVYSDVALKSASTLCLPRTVERDLQNRSGQIEARFHEVFLPALHKNLTHWNALDFSHFNLETKIEFAAKLTRYFIDDVYVMAEQINILASFLTLEAEQACENSGLDVLRTLQGPVPHSPAHMIAKGAHLADGPRQKYLLSEMGHRAIFDYELSMPRYLEAPEALFNLAKSTAFSRDMEQGFGADTNLPEVVKLSLRFQDLKEHAKHESLRVFAVLRKVLLEIDGAFNGDGLVFYLTCEELLACNAANCAALKIRASDRLEQFNSIKEFAPSQANLSLHDCELFSSPTGQVSRQDGEIEGVCVSGDQAISGKVYFAEESDDPAGGALSDFAQGTYLFVK